MATSLRGSKAAAPVSSSSNYSRLPVFSMDAGDTVIIRFLTDSEPTELADGTLAGGKISVFQHSFVQTKNQPKGYTGQNWPRRMTAVCRDQDVSELGIPNYDECFLCKAGEKVSKRTWALAVIREEVREGTTILGYRDATRTVTRKTDDGEVEETVPAVVYINLGQTNFFGPLEGYYGRFGTILDRDFAITRVGDDKSTTYSPIGLDPIKDGDGKVFDVRDPELMARYLPAAATDGYAVASDKSLAPIIANAMSDDFYAKFFDTRVDYVIPEKNSGGGTGGVTTAPTPQAVAAPSNDVSAVDMESLRARITPQAVETPATEGSVPVAL